MTFLSRAANNSLSKIPPYVDMVELRNVRHIGAIELSAVNINCRRLTALAGLVAMESKPMRFNDRRFRMMSINVVSIADL